jgi:integrase
VFTTGAANEKGETDLPIASFAVIKRELLKQMAAVDPVLAGKMPQFGFHDLRRTLRTRMSGLGVEPHVCERVIAHEVGNAITQTYDRHSYLSEKRVALERWCAALLEIVAPPLTAVPVAASA